MYNFGQTAKLKAQQRKQMDRYAKRRIVKQSKANIKSGTPNKESDIAESSGAVDVVEVTA